MAMQSNATSIEGVCPPEFAAVAEEFSKNFDKRGDVGAALAVYLDGELVIDLYGGYTDAARTQPWQPDTLVNVYSTTKGMLATAMHILAGRGVLDIEKPVAHYWPTFAKHGKKDVLVRHVLTHEAGLPAPSVDVPDEAVYDWPTMIDALAESELYWQPGEKTGYHAATYGWLAGEVLHRITGMTPGQFVGNEIAVALGADVFIGLPPAEDARTAEMLLPLPAEDGSPSALAALRADPDSLPARVFGNPPRPPEVANTRRWRQAEIPSSNGHASARGLARMYAALGNGGSLDGVQLMPPESVDIARAERVAGKDVILGMPVRRALGYMLPVPEQGDRRGPGAFGHAGMGGSIGYADPDHRLGFGYVMNQMGPPLDSRAASLSRALYAALEARE